MTPHAHALIDVEFLKQKLFMGLELQITGIALIDDNTIAISVEGLAVPKNCTYVNVIYTMQATTVHLESADG